MRGQNKTAEEAWRDMKSADLRARFEAEQKAAARRQVAASVLAGMLTASRYGRDNGELVAAAVKLTDMLLEALEAK